MYQTYLWKIKPLSSYMTPWQSDTIYGHLFWAILYNYGEEELKQVLDEFKKNRPQFIVSDGFIGDKLPLIEKDYVSSDIIEFFSQKYKKSLFEIAREVKKIKSIENISLEEFNRLRKNNYSNIDWIEENLFLKRKEDIDIVNFEKIYNRINRISNTVEENGLFSLEENFVNKEIYIYIKLREGYSPDKFFNLLKYIEQAGYGKKTSIGKGAIKTISFERFKGFENKEIKGNGFITLSNYIPKEYDYSSVIKSLPLIKRGKVHNTDVPFKKPFSCFRAGSIFKDGDNKIKGKILEGLHKNNDIIQVGIPFTLEVEL